MKNKKSKNSVFDYLVLLLLCVVPLLSVTGFMMYFFDVQNSLLNDFIGIIAAVAIAVILQRALGFKEILRCATFSCVWVGIFSIVIIPIPAVTVLMIGLIIFLLRHYLYNKNTTNSEQMR